MKVLVTGATGFIGREIVEELSKNEIVPIELGNSKKSAENGKKIYKADISNFEALSKLEKLGDVDAIVHSAGLAHQFGDVKRESFEAVNVSGTANVANLAVKLKAKQFVLISSTAVYGLKKNKIDENTICQPETIYAESKLKAERVCREICEKNSIDLTILRLSPVIGEGSGGNTARLISAIYKNRFLWIGNGANLKTLIYKKDVARAVLTILKNKKRGTEIFNLGAEPIRMKDFVLEIEKNLNRKILPIFVPANLLKSVFYLNLKTFNLTKANKIGEIVEKWLSDDIYSAEKIERDYNFKAQTPIREAIKRQVKHFLSFRSEK